jgi:hypothetical protein
MEILDLKFESVVYFFGVNGSIKICSGASAGSTVFAPV